MTKPTRTVLQTTTLVLALAVLTLAQQTDQNAISAASVSLFPPPDFYINVNFTNALAEPATDLVTTNIAIKTTPSTTLNIATVERLAGSRKAARIIFSGTPPTNLTSLNLCFHHLTFIENAGTDFTQTEVCTAVQLLSKDNIVAAKQQLLKELNAVPKTANEKNIFASGFVTTASTGSQGGMDLNLNSNDLGIPGMTAFLHMKKTTTPNGDPKNFEVGTNFRNTYIFGRSDVDEMRKDISTIRANASPAAVEAATKDLQSREDKIQQRLLSAVLIDFAGKLEGGATDFNVANYVGDAQVQLQSRTKALGTSERGFWQFRIIPFGLEGGKNVQSTTTTTTGAAPSKQDYVARIKGGAGLRFFYDNPETPLPFKRVELDLSTVQRFLFFKETEILKANAAPVLSDGHRPWYQADLKIYVAEAASGRYGARLTYNNGSLPPEYARTKSFQFGFVFETADGEGKKPGK